MLHAITFRDMEADLDLDQVRMTHWNHSHTKGSRIDRVYKNESPLNLPSRVDYFHFPFGDHIGRCLQIGHFAKIKRSIAFPRGALEIKAIREAVKLIWLKAEVDSQNLEGQALLDSLHCSKKEILSTTCSMYKSIVNKRKGRINSLKREIKNLMSRREKGKLSTAAASTLSSLNRQLAEIEADEQARSQARKRVLTIRHGGKSNRHFFRPPARKRSPIGNLNVDDSPKESLTRTSDTPILCNNFEKTYQSTYKKKVIDLELLKDISKKISLEISAEHRKMLAMVKLF